MVQRLWYKDYDTKIIENVDLENIYIWLIIYSPLESLDLQN